MRFLQSDGCVGPHIVRIQYGKIVAFAAEPLVILAVSLDTNHRVGTVLALLDGVGGTDHAATGQQLIFIEHCSPADGITDEFEVGILQIGGYAGIPTVSKQALPVCTKTDSVSLLLTFKGLYLHAQFVGHDGVEEDADDGGNGEARQMDGAHGDVVVGTVLHADG